MLKSYKSYVQIISSKITERRHWLILYLPRQGWTSTAARGERGRSYWTWLTPFIFSWPCRCPANAFFGWNLWYTKLTFKLDFSGNLWLTAFTILAMFSFAYQISLNDILRIYTRTQKDLYLNANIRTVCINDVSNSCQYFRSIYSLCFNQARCFLLLRCLNRVMGWVLYHLLQDSDTILWFSFCVLSLFIDQVLRELVSTREASMGVRKLCVRGGLSYISMGGQYQDYTDTS